MTTNNEAFEKWAKDHEYAIDDYVYALEIWQAATANSASEVAELKHDRNEWYKDAQDKRLRILELQAHINHLREALDMLVITKDYKDKQGKDAVYETMRTNAWNVAQQALSATKKEGC